MSELQEVEVVIDPRGNIKAHVKGAKGQSCLRITEEMFQLLGNQIEQQQLTDDYRRQAEQQQNNQGIAIG